jgi:hypothetical protein
VYRPELVIEPPAAPSRTLQFTLGWDAVNCSCTVWIMEPTLGETVRGPEGESDPPDPPPQDATPSDSANAQIIRAYQGDVPVARIIA